MIKKSLFLGLLTATLLFHGCSDDDKEQSNTQANKAISAPQYALTSTDNKEFIIQKKLDGFILKGGEGKVILFDIFATWCPPCRASAPHLSSLQKKFKDDLVIIGLTIEDGITNEALNDFKFEYNAEYAIANSSANRPLINDIANALKLGERFPIPLMALYYDGKLINHYVGEVQEEFVQSDIRRALGQ